jgi:hypothetical protein
MTLAEDLATYLPRLGRSHPLDRYARATQFAPGSDEALMLGAMRHARFLTVGGGRRSAHVAIREPTRR